MLDQNKDANNAERRVGPTVSRDKWLLHARQKLAKGYVLIYTTGKKRANFWHRDRGYEMCAFEVARALIASGEVQAAGEHHLGTMYQLKDGVPMEPLKRPRIIDDDDDITPDVADSAEVGTDVEGGEDVEEAEEEADDEDEDLDEDLEPTDLP